MDHALVFQFGRDVAALISRLVHEMIMRDVNAEYHSRVLTTEQNAGWVCVRHWRTPRDIYHDRENGVRPEGFYFNYRHYEEWVGSIDSARIYNWTVGKRVAKLPKHYWVRERSNFAL